MTLFRSRRKAGTFDFLFLWLFLCLGYFVQGFVGVFRGLWRKVR